MWTRNVTNFADGNSQVPGATTRRPSAVLGEGAGEAKPQASLTNPAEVWPVLPRTPVKGTRVFWHLYFTDPHFFFS